jgi:hypothetical protein
VSKSAFGPGPVFGFTMSKPSLSCLVAQHFQ